MKILIKNLAYFNKKKMMKRVIEKLIKIVGPINCMVKIKDLI